MACSLTLVNPWNLQNFKYEYLVCPDFRIYQWHIAPLAYWHDLDETRYKDGSTFLAVINNEKEINPDYVKNLQRLKKLVLVKYENDIGVVPRESCWFGYFDKNEQIVPLLDLELYKSDRLGLKAMNENGNLDFLLAPGKHLHLDESWFVGNIVPFFRN